ncbi:hypothetical protein BJP25_02850 [Actinokineospora bangkokensis]|uniref:Uncharacterized protein n=2 Tax=Actinokineospora bangkokensis TaxID=1193682 RepID=A0A1Q9LE87_9PSEU|nr:hypothetical protein BJP25_02850 [Actinokineospora bangkokensis]
MLAWGAWLAVEFGSASFRDAWQGLAIFVGGPLLHDLLIAPVVGGVAVLIGRLVPRWAGPVKAGVVASAVLALLAVPLLWRPFGVPVNPGLHDRDYWAGLGIALGVVWVGVLAFLGVRALVRSRQTGAAPEA